MISYQPGSNAIVMRGVATSSAEFRTDSQVVGLPRRPADDRELAAGRASGPSTSSAIESLPGPQGTLFGSSSQTGTMVYVTNKPDTSGFGAQIDAELSTTERRRRELRRQRPRQHPGDRQLRDPRRRLLLRGRRLRRQRLRNHARSGRFDNAAVVEEDWNDYTIYGGRVAARWQISPDWEIDAQPDRPGRARARAAGNPTRRSATTRSPASSTSPTTTAGTRPRSTSRATSASPTCR